MNSLAYVAMIIIEARIIRRMQLQEFSGLV
jgi:hypothetical protein